MCPYKVKNVNQFNLFYWLLQIWGYFLFFYPDFFNKKLLDFVFIYFFTFNLKF